MVSPGDALPHRAHEEDCPLNARTPRTDSQLFPRSKVALQRRRRGSEQQSQSHYEKILRLPNVPLPRTRALSLTWQITGAGINPRFFLTNLFFFVPFARAVQRSANRLMQQIHAIGIVNLASNPKHLELRVALE